MSRLSAFRPRLSTWNPYSYRLGGPRTPMTKLPSWLAKDDSHRGVCAFCGAPIVGAKEYAIAWDEVNKEFQVQLTLLCPGCWQFSEPQLVKSIPVIIANESRCSCGGALILKSYSFRRTSEDLAFEGIYACERCSAERRSTKNRIKQALAGLWSSTRRIEVGLTGVKYEKDE